MGWKKKHSEESAIPSKASLVKLKLNDENCSLQAWEHNTNCKVEGKIPLLSNANLTTVR